MLKTTVIGSHIEIEGMFGTQFPANIPIRLVVGPSAMGPEQCLQVEVFINDTRHGLLSVYSNSKTADYYTIPEKRRG